MLAPRYLEGLSDEIVEIYAQLENDILRDMARRVARLGKITEATKWQAQILAETGALKKDVTRILNKYNPQIQKEITAIYNDALVKNARADNRIFQNALGRTVSEKSAQLMLASIQKTYSDLSRLTITTAATTERKFVQVANAAYMQTVSGAFDYDTATKNAVDTLAREGITAVQYQNGRPVQRTIESAVRMNILTGVNQTASTITLNNCDELGVDLVETSAHIGARPEHEEWQGQIFSLSGSSDKYPPFSICRYGEADGICGINCRHSFYPYFEGTDKHYTLEELDEMASEKVSYNGQDLTRYEGEQKLRSIERNIRKYKREVAVEDAAGIDTTFARTKLGQWQATAREFTEQTGIKRDSAREFIGTVNGTQPKSISPTVSDYSKNVKLAQEIKRLDNSKNKLVAKISAGEPMTFAEADGSKPNPFYNLNSGYQKNCQSCVVTYELRRRGYNVQTLPNTRGSMLEVLSRNTSLAWIDKETGKNPAYIIPNARTTKEAFNFLQNELKLNNRYTIEFSWRGGSCGHIIHIIRQADGVHLYDPQTNMKFAGLDVAEYLKRVKTSSIKLLDVQNCDINLNVVNKILKGAK